jgi:hypothetical protein
LYKRFDLPRFESLKADPKDNNVSITLSVYAPFIPTLQADAAQGVHKWLRQELANKVGGKWAGNSVFFGQGRLTK